MCEHQDRATTHESALAAATGVLIVSVETAKGIANWRFEISDVRLQPVPLGGDKTPIKTGKVYDNGRLEIFGWKDWQITAADRRYLGANKKPEWW